jgi:hypothetical protein
MTAAITDMLQLFGKRQFQTLQETVPEHSTELGLVCTGTGLILSDGILTFLGTCKCFRAQCLVFFLVAFPFLKAEGTGVLFK